MGHVAAEPARLYAEVFGDPAKREQRSPLVFIHGWLMDHRVWSSAAGSLALSSWSRLCVDLRGHGQSPHDVGTGLDAHVDDLLALADMEGWATFTLVGHSMGGAIAQHLAARAPQRVDKLVLVAPVPMSGFPLPPELHAQFASLANDRSALREFLRSQLSGSQALELGVEVAASCPRLTVERTLDAWTAGGALAPGAKVRAPTLILGGADDQYMSPDVLRQQVLAEIENAELSVMQGCGHYPQLDQPDKVAESIAAFLET